MKYKYVPTYSGKIHQYSIYNVIEGENRIAQIEVSFCLMWGKKEATVWVIRPDSLNYNPEFKKEIKKFANNLINEYETIVEEGITYWVKK